MADDKLFPGLDDALAEGTEKSKRSYELKILKKIYEALFDLRSFRRDCKVHGEDFGMNAFNDEGPIPILLFVPETKITVQPAHVLRTSGFTKTQLYTSFRDVVDRYKASKSLERFDPRAAMFFPIRGMSNFVMHNYEHLSITNGTNVVMRFAKNNTVLRIEPLTSFITALELRHK